MNRKWISATVLLLSLFVLSALLFHVRAGRIQGSSQSRFPQHTREFATRTLESPKAKYLSGSGLNALYLTSGQAAIPRSLQGGPPVKSLPFQSSRSEVLVNDPSTDVFTGPFDISTQSETANASFNNNVVVAYNDSGEFALGNSFEGYARSTDGGVTFTDLGPMPNTPNGLNLGDPALATDRAGNIYHAYLAFDFAQPSGFESTIGIAKSTDEGATFGTPVLVPNANLVPFSFEDKEFMAADDTGGPHSGNVYVSFTNFNPDPNLGIPIFFSRSTDGGATFSLPIPISSLTDICQGSEPAVGPGGEVYVAYFRFFSLPPANNPPAILITKSTDGGQSFSAPVTVAPVAAIGFGGGTLLGNFRVNSFPRMDVNPLNGQIYITYAANPPGPDGADVFLTRSTDGGATWSTPARVNQDPGTTDQFFPDVAVNSAGVIKLIWYDRRLDPAANLKIDVFTTESTNGGLSFAPDKRVTLVSSLPAVGYDPIVNPVYMGDYIDIRANSGPGGRGSSFLMSWGDFRRVITTNGGTRHDQDVFFSRSQ